MMSSRLVVVGFVVALSLSIAPFSPAGDVELAWIGQIPGLKPALQRGGPTGEAIYEVKGDPAVVFEKLHAGFVRNGWTIEKFRNAGLAGVALRTLVAVKGGTRAKAILAAGEGGSLIVNFAPADRDASAASSSAEAASAAAAAASAVRDVIKVNRPPAPAASAAPATPPAPATRTTGTATPAGPRLVLLENRTTGAWACHETEVVVNSNSNDFALEGDCRDVIVNGNRNRIHITGRVTGIETKGKDNVVSWSAAANPTPPRQRKLGEGSQITRVE